MSPDDQAENLPSKLVSTEDAVIQDLPPQEGSSDGEGGERTAREKLKKTSIAGLSQYSKAGNATGDHPLGEVTNIESVPEPQTENGLVRGRPSKKRSFDDLQNEEPGLGIENGGPPLPKKGTQHKRMRSREISGDDEEAQSLDQNEDMASPVHEENGAEAQHAPGGPGVLVSAPSKEEMDGAATTNVPDVEDTTAQDTLPTVAPPVSDKQRAAAKTGTSTTLQSTEQQEPTPQIPAASGFANKSTASPFSGFKSPKSPEKSTESNTLSLGSTTSNSAFASSGLSAFASSEKSPFGAVGSTAKSSGGFGGGTASGGFGSTSGGFGGVSPFATKPASGFGSGGGFGSAGGFGGGGGFGAAAKPFGGGLSSFAGAAGSSGTFGKAKPFGAKTNEDDEEASEEGGDDGHRAQQAEMDAQQDPRFHQQELNTGEEDEQTIFSCTAKLYHFEKEWKESGVGDFKINIRYEAISIPAADDEKTGINDEAQEKELDLEADQSESSSRLERKARLIMRARGTHRLVLNTPVFKEMNVGTHDGKEPNGKTMHLTGLEEGKPTGYQIKVGKEEMLKEIYHKIRELQEEL